jgi:nicotinamide mononucleotide adenylyltransferase
VTKFIAVLAIDDWLRQTEAHRVYLRTVPNVLMNDMVVARVFDERGQWIDPLPCAGSRDRIHQAP